MSSILNFLSGELTVSGFDSPIVCTSKKAISKADAISLFNLIES